MSAASLTFSRRDRAFPAIDLPMLTTAVIAGAFATLAFDLFGQWLSPTLGFAKLAPVGLANSVLNTIAGAKLGAGHLLHVLTGVLLYPIGYFLIARPLQRAILPALPQALTGAIYGAVLWAFALYGMAHLVAGLKPFLGFAGLTWVALAGHVLYGIVLVGVARLREAR